MRKGEAAQVHHLEGVSRYIFPKKTLVRILNRTNEIAHINGGSSVYNDTICGEGSDALGGTGPGREQSD
jgi:hypothetical protein